MVCMANVLITMASVLLTTPPALQTCTACATYCNFNLGKKCPTGFCHGSAKQMCDCKTCNDKNACAQCSPTPTPPTPTSPAPTPPTPNDRIFSVYVYDNQGRKAIPSGYSNNAQLGCNPLSNVSHTAAFVAFVSNPVNGVGAVKLDSGPLLRDNATFWPIYLSIIRELHIANVESAMMVSDTPNSFTEYVTNFHAVVDDLLGALRSVTPTSPSLGIVYDVEGDRYNASLWTTLYASILTHDDEAATAFPDGVWSGFTFWGPYVAYKDGAPLYATARSIEWGTYFAGDEGDINASLDKIGDMSPTPAKISVGIQLTAEDKNCRDGDYASCSASLVWGKGVRSGESLSQWAHRALLPNLAARGYNASSAYDGGGRLDDPPLYVESLPAMMAFAANAARGVLPCPECSAAAGDVSFCSAYSHAEGGN